MDIKLFIEENNFVKLCLFSGKRQIECILWQDENDLSVKLLANFEKILRKNGSGLDPVRNSRKRKIKRTKEQNISNGVDKIREYKIISEVPRKWTTYRIAEITLKTLKIGQGIAKK